ncbi:MAG: type II toxin-antitoxin system RelE/ParE family toxin [Calditrichia bacterium]|nr:type II toxin-antitoxin system RelE/ParE family toxin [Calditrichia bacterium]
MKLKWSPLALERLIEIVNYIAEDKPIASKNFAQSIFKSIEKLKRFPKLGRIVPELNKPAYREIIIGNYRIIYMISDDIITILTIRHGKRILDGDNL